MKGGSGCGAESLQKWRNDDYDWERNDKEITKWDFYATSGPSSETPMRFAKYSAVFCSFHLLLCATDTNVIARSFSSI